MFWKSNISKKEIEPSKRHSSFAYLNDDVYLDAACQTLRPQEVIDAQNEYYMTYNACGDRVKHKWGNVVDQKIQKARQEVLKFAGASQSEYEVAFTLNTTYGINLILNQLNPDDFDQIIISEIEHNSVYVPAQAWSKKHQKKLYILPRNENGEVEYKKNTCKKAILIVNTASNIDGRELVNISEITKDIQSTGGVVILDAAQGLTHNPDRIRGVKYDALVSSAHKVYGPSLGVMIVSKKLLQRMTWFFLGGSTVTDTTRENHMLYEQEQYHLLEPGLQNFAGIIGFAEALKWVEKFSLNGQNQSEYEDVLSKSLFEGLKSLPLNLVNTQSSPVVSFYHDSIDSHQMGSLLSQKGIMCRTGYFCCHAYLVHDKKLPPLTRVSLGLYNTKEDIEYLLKTLTFITDNIS